MNKEIVIDIDNVRGAMILRGNKVLIVGCGDIGIPLAEKLVSQGAQVWGMRRQVELLPDYIQPLAADVTDVASLEVLSGLRFDYVVITLTPAGFSAEGYQRIFVTGMSNLLSALKGQPHLKRILHVSSTSVYHQSDGEWVDEDSPTLPQSFSGQSLLQSEQLVLASGFAATIVRFAGIYGPGRRRLIEQVLRGEGCPKQPLLYTNRIHRDDCVGVLEHLLQLCESAAEIESCYLGVDSEPAAMWDVKHWLATLLGASLNESVETSDHRRNNKRCSNKRLLASGYQFCYPSYRQGYLSLL